MHTCPTNDELERLFAGEAGDARSADLTAHVAACDRCRQWLDEARADEQLLDPVRQALRRGAPRADRGSSMGAPLGPGTNAPAAAEAALAQIAGFELIRKIGEGGMGVVFEAEQEQPRRRVAIKIVRGGAWADELRNRLIEREAAALARLRHPGIAAIYGAGRTADGANYFAMELVSGVPLTDYARQHSLGLRVRLALFCDICAAINYAHQRGVVHRDLKPGNILVGEEPKGPGSRVQGSGSRVQDSGSRPSTLDPEPRTLNPISKVLDFGLARIIDPDDDGRSLLTEVGKIRGTLAYMSPEQAAARGDEIDLRSDIYSLGVVLYELLTDHLPYDLKRKPIADAIRIISQEPPTPPASYAPRLRGDLQTIILKALEKDPDRRYDRAAAIAEDIQRYLTRRPIMARPPTWVYTTGRFIARHRLACVFALTVTTLLIGFGVVATMQAARIATERDKAIQASRFLQGMLADFDPAHAGGPDMPLRNVLDMAARRVDSELLSQPEVAASLRVTLSDGYLALGLYGPAERELRLALETRRMLFGNEHPTVAQCQHHLGVIFSKAERFAEAEPLQLEALELRRRLIPRDDLAIAESLNDLGGLRARQERYADAEPLIREAIELRRSRMGEQDVEVTIGMANLSLILFHLGRIDDAKPLAEKAIATRRQLLGDDDPQGLIFLNNWATLMLHMHRDLDTCERYFREVLARRKHLLGPQHPDVVEALENLGRLLKMRGDVAGAEACRREISEIRAITASQPGSGS